MWFIVADVICDVIGYIFSRLATDDVSYLLLFEPNDAMIVPIARFQIVCMMIKNPPFTKRDSPLNTESLMDDLWRMMT